MIPTYGVMMALLYAETYSWLFKYYIVEDFFHITNLMHTSFILQGLEL